MSSPSYLRIWLAGVRYSLVRTMMFRGDFLVWSLVELFWMSINLLLITVIYQHTTTVAGWSKYEMMLLVGTSLLIQRFLMGFFWSNLFEMGRNIRSGHFDFFLAQPGNPMFMVSTRKLDPDGLANSVVAAGVVAYSLHKLGIHPGFASVSLYAALILCGVVIHYSALVLICSLTFWSKGGQGVEGSYFTLFEFARLPRQAFKGVANILFVWILPVVVVSNGPARTLIYGFQPRYAAWIALISVLWFGIAVIVFHSGLRRYTSASS